MSVSSPSASPSFASNAFQQEKNATLRTSSEDFVISPSRRKTDEGTPSPRMELKKSLSVEKISSLKTKPSFASNSKKAQSLPRRFDLEKAREEDATNRDSNDESSKTPPLAPTALEGVPSIVGRGRSDTIGSSGENSKKSTRQPSTKKTHLPSILPILDKEESGTQSDPPKSLDLATTKKRHTTVSTKSNGRYKGPDRVQGTIPVKFWDLPDVKSSSSNLLPPSPRLTERPQDASSVKVKHASGGPKGSKPTLKTETSKVETAKTVPTVKQKKPTVNATKESAKEGKDTKDTTPSTPSKKTTSTSGAARTKPLVSTRKNTRVFSPTSMLKTNNVKQTLSTHEQKEMLEYSEIFYTGDVNAKIMNPSKNAPNNGYDDEKGDYKIIPKDHVAYRYEIVSVLGSGAFGQVAKVYDHKSGKHLALKIIRNRKRYHDQALIEHKILAYIKQKDPHSKSNIINMVDFFYFRNHICFTTELMSINLYEFIKNNNFRGSSEKLIRKFSVQLLQSMRFLAKHRIIHCDLKPENILLNDINKSDITLIDFGSSCFEHEKIFTYIQSRFYRAPEIILGLPYGISIDMWSFGCILAEIYTGYPLFPGENELDQLACIMEVLGLPPEDLLKEATRKKYFFASNGKPRIIENSNGIKRYPGTKTLEDFLPGADPQMIHFIAECLKWYPKERLTPANALQHPWILLDGPVENFNNDLID